MITEETVNRIVAEIQEIEQDYKNNQGMILSEDDLKCHIFGKIMPLLPPSVETYNEGINGSPLHSEPRKWLRCPLPIW